MSFAVIKTGGKQYLIEPKNKIKVEKLKAKEGQEVVFDQVLLYGKNKKLEIGKPLLKKKIKGKVIKQGRGDKIIVFKYKAKKRYKKKQGHRQPYTEVEIIEV